MDYFKGILMFGVILGHVITAFKAGFSATLPIHTFIRTYDMPFFILISGIFMAKSIDRYVPWKNMINKITGIILPLILWNTAFVLIKSIYLLILHVNSFNALDFLNSLLSSSWFLWSVFICSLIMICICWIFKSVQLRIIASIIISALCLFIPLDKYNISFMFPFFALGFFFEWAKSKLNDKIVEILKGISVILFIVMICFWKTSYNIWNTPAYLLNGDLVNTLIITLFRFFIGCTGCVTMAIVFDILRQSKNTIMGFINRCFISAGKNTLVIYIFQGFFLEFAFAKLMTKFVESYGSNIFISNLNLLGYVIAPITAFVCLLVLDKVVIYMKKIPCIGKYIFGFKAIDARKAV